LREHLKKIRFERVVDGEPVVSTLFRASDYARKPAAFVGFLKPAGEAKSTGGIRSDGFRRKGKCRTLLQARHFSNCAEARRKHTSQRRSPLLSHWLRRTRLLPQTTRPFIPPLEESFEQAWERAKLTFSTRSPHLSALRRAASSPSRWR